MSAMNLKTRLRPLIIEQGKPPVLVLQLRVRDGEDINFRPMYIWRDATVEDMTEWSEDE